MAERTSLIFPRQCQRCERWYVSRRADGRYCTIRCQEAARRDRRDAAAPISRCAWCDKAFRRRNLETGKQPLYCSPTCAHTKKAAKASPLHVRQCPVCSAAFIARHAQRKFCSDPCRSEHTRRYAAALYLASTPWPTCIDCTQPMERRTQGVHCCATCRATRLAETNRSVRRRRRARRRNATTERYTAREIFTRDRWRCGLCGKPVARTKAVPHPRAPVIDHIVPLSQDGDDTRANVQCAHFICNSIKGDRPAGEQLRLIG